VFDALIVIPVMTATTAVLHPRLYSHRRIDTLIMYPKGEKRWKIVANRGFKTLSLQNIVLNAVNKPWVKKHSLALR
jgi:hypothetical protein